MPEERTGVITFKGNGLTLVGPEIKVGDSAPDFTVLAADRSEVRLADSAGKARIISVVLSRLNPGDTFAVARIDTASFSERDIIAKVTFDERPSIANQQKRQFQTTIKRFVKNVRPAAYTDITGGLLQAAEFLNEKNPGQKVILVFSDLAEDLKKGYIRDIPLPLEDFEVIALNVTKLGRDNVDPRKYMKRLEKWQQRVEEGGGNWRVINDLDNIDRIIKG